MPPRDSYNAGSFAGPWALSWGAGAGAQAGRGGAWRVAKPVVGAVVGLIMGSQSDWATMRAAAAVLEELAVAHERRIVSAHRTPERLYRYATSAQERGLKVIIAGAGGAAHLPGMAAALTMVPGLGVP